MDEDKMLERLVEALERTATACERFADAHEKMLAMDEDARRQYQQQMMLHNQ